MNSINKNQIKIENTKDEVVLIVDKFDKKVGSAQRKEMVRIIC